MKKKRRRRNTAAPRWRWLVTPLTAIIVAVIKTLIERWHR
jgi:hypothetical protein